MNTFTLVNKKGERHFVKFHWDPELGVHSLTWDEGKLFGNDTLHSIDTLTIAQKIAGQDPDFHRKDLEEAINSGAYPKWTFSIQVLREDQEDDFDFEYVFFPSRRFRFLNNPQHS